MGIILDMLNETLIQPEDEETEEEINFPPTREEIDIQNQTHGTQCKDCKKAVNNTPNPNALMRYCNYEGVMVSKFSTSCEHFKCIQ
jgi:hypothetical protein